MTIDITPKAIVDRNLFWREIIIASALSIDLAIALGFSRFPCGLLLPPMWADLGKAYIETGTLDTLLGLHPHDEIYSIRAAKWLTPIEGTKRFPQIM